MTTAVQPEPNKNLRLAILLAAAAIAMIGLAFASVPLYRLFCQVTGFGGTTQVATNAYDVPILDRDITVSFNADTAPGLPWRFEPVQRKVTLKVGEEALVYYRAVNNSDHDVVGTAIFNVTPHKAGSYFNKIECFCFTEQRLKPGESMEMPVTFFVDPALDNDVNLDEVQEITLSYTFFEVKQ